MPATQSPRIPLATETGECCFTSPIDQIGLTGILYLLYLFPLDFSIFCCLLERIIRLCPHVQALKGKKWLDSDRASSSLFFYQSAELFTLLHSWPDKHIYMSF